MRGWGRGKKGRGFWSGKRGRSGRGKGKNRGGLEEEGRIKI